MHFKPRTSSTRRVILLAGCAQRALDPGINASTIRVLNKLGVEVTVRQEAACCGALAHHIGERKAAHQTVSAALLAWREELERGDVDAIIANASGCGTMVKDYAHMVGDDPELGAIARQVSGLARDITEVIADLPLNDQLWIYPTLDWRYLPDGPEGSDLDNKVYRTIQYVSRSVAEDEQAAQPELVSVLAGSRFDANSFMTLGYSPTEFATADFLSRNHGSIELRQDFIDENTDTLFIKNDDAEVIALDRYPGYTREDNHPDCLRIELDYNMEQVRIFASDGEHARIDDPDSTDEQDTIANPDNCTYQEDADAITSWTTVPVAGR